MILRCLKDNGRHYAVDVKRINLRPGGSGGRTVSENSVCSLPYGTMTLPLTGRRFAISCLLVDVAAFP